MINFDEVKSAAVGKWPNILAALGISVSDNQKKHTCCPVCSPGDPKSDRFRFTNETGNGEWFCNQCSPKKAGNGIGLVMKVLDVDYKAAMTAIAPIVGTVEMSKYQKEQPISPDLLRKIFKESLPVEKGDSVHLYLKTRGLTSMPKTLRYSPACYEPETKKNQRAMLALFTLQDGTAVTMHRTFITDDGRKLDIEHPKKALPTLRPMSGGAVRLYPQEATLGVCEGVETAIALRNAMRVPVWAVLGTALLAGFEPPKGVETVIIYSDNDANFAGQKAAYDLANRLVVKNKLRVSVEIPSVAGDDFLDEINRQ